MKRGKDNAPPSVAYDLPAAAEEAGPPDVIVLSSDSESEGFSVVEVNQMPAEQGVDEAFVVECMREMATRNRLHIDGSNDVAPNEATWNELMRKLRESYVLNVKEVRVTNTVVAKMPETWPTMPQCTEVVWSYNATDPLPANFANIFPNVTEVRIESNGWTDAKRDLVPLANCQHLTTVYACGNKFDDLTAAIGALPQSVVDAYFMYQQVDYLRCAPPSEVDVPPNLEHLSLESNTNLGATRTFLAYLEKLPLKYLSVWGCDETKNWPLTIGHLTRQPDETAYRVAH